MSNKSLSLSVMVCVFIMISVSGCKDSDQTTKIADKVETPQSEVKNLSERPANVMKLRGETVALSGLRIFGEVKQELHFVNKDLERFDNVTARSNEVSRSGHYSGAFTFRGPSLRSLLEFSGIEKKGSDFNKDLDLAILVRNREGKKVVFSWGEIFYRNPGDIIVAVEAEPIRPHHERNRIPKAFWPWLDQLDRIVGLPKLVVATDFYSDRSLEDIQSIEVVDLHPDVHKEEQEVLFSPTFSISGSVANPADISVLPDSNRTNVLFKEVGDGQGYHGLKSFGGVPLTDLLRQAGIRGDIDTAVIVSSPDGYRTILSYGELFLSNIGKNTLIGDTMAGEAVTARGKFFLVIPDDLSADRSVKAIQEIRVVSLKEEKYR
ncbi:MAG: hypothetical protein PHY29_10375 [Syntrophales bacterium]|nr:hypothetical protein [Syntrophales bacterium]